MAEITPYYDKNGITIYCGDSLEIMAELTRLKLIFDAIVTDPPYETTDLDFDKNADGVGVKVATTALDLVKNNGYLVAFSPIEMLAMFVQIGWKLRYSGAWVKQMGGMRTHSAKKPMNQLEIYATYAHPKHKIKNLTYNKVLIPGEPYLRVRHNRGYQREGKDQLARADTSGWTKEGYESINDGTRELTDVLFCPNKGGLKHSERTKHPTQKPEKVISWLCQRHTNAGDLILDPFLGSGTTAKVGLDLGRRIVGVEEDENWCKVAVSRLAQDSLFSINMPPAKTETKKKLTQVIFIKDEKGE